MVVGHALAQEPKWPSTIIEVRIDRARTTLYTLRAVKSRMCNNVEVVQ